MKPDYIVVTPVLLINEDEAVAITSFNDLFMYPDATNLEILFGIYKYTNGIAEWVEDYTNFKEAEKKAKEFNRPVYFWNETPEME